MHCFRNASLILIFLICLLPAVCGFNIMGAQTFEVKRIEPPNWWVGMHDSTLQLIVYGTHLNELTFESGSEYITVATEYAPENRNYYFVTLTIRRNTPPGKHTFYLKKGGNVDTIEYPLFDRDPSPQVHQGFSSKDVIYLITPDRFVNGDHTNDQIRGLLDGHQPDNIIGRHGGDIAGVISKLAYLQELGVTAIWINPLVENDMPISYHGYGATDFYRIDPRFGNNQQYKRLVTEAHRHGIKVIIDHVSNHIGINHPWIDDLPMPDWINGSPGNHQRTRHHKEVHHDIHHDALELTNLKEGWFVDELPDLNQKNPFLARYLIQNTIWWLEFSGADGIREDTYPYADEKFLAEWAQHILTEYPNLNIVGEVWIHDPVFLAAYLRDSYLTGNFNTHLPSVTDFGLFDAIGNVFHRNQSISVLYHLISRDFLYPDPDQLLIFADNHDVMRTMDAVDGDLRRYEMIFKILLTMRGIPQIYYGSEIGLAGGGHDHGKIRSDFPGGFTGDARNAFVAAGRTAQEDKIFNLLQRLIQMRTEYPALSTGTLNHLPPQNEIYIYFRSLPDQRIMVIVNNNAEEQEIDLRYVAHYLEGYVNLQELITGQESMINSDSKVLVQGSDAGIYLLMK